MKGLYFLLLILIGGNALAQANLDAMLETTHTSVAEQERIKANVDAFLQPLAVSHVSEISLLRSTFRKVHRAYLKKYIAYSDINAVFTTGQYDCLTATALFSYVLDQLKYNYEIIETNYHIFLVVNTSKGKVLLETTDRFGGFIMGEVEIRRRMQLYKDGFIASSESNKYYYQYSFKLCQQISFEKLIGLLYYNKAVYAFNHHDWKSCAMLLEKSHALYASPRCEELGSILIQSVLESSLTDEAKTNCLLRLRNFGVKKSEIIASN